MATQKRRGVAKLEHDPIVGRVLGKEHVPRGGMICIGGFVGASPLANHVRLFTKIDFSECLDIPDDAIVGHERIQKAGLPGGTYIWIERDAVFGLTVVDPTAQLSSFLQGPILQHSGAATRMSARGPGGAGIFSTPICSILVSLATASIVLCTRIERMCPDPTTDNCPEPPEPIPNPGSIVV